MTKPKCSTALNVNLVLITLVTLVYSLSVCGFTLTFAANSENAIEQLKPDPPISIPAVDKFGVEMLYPTKHAGQEWYMNMENPTSDQRFNPRDHITRNHDGSWKMKSNQVRMSVYTTNGYNPNQITAYSGQSKLAEQGYMGSANDWRDIEVTGFVKLNAFTENDNFVWYSRGGKHTDSDHCQGSAYKGNLFYTGQTQFSKEQWHVSYVKSPTISATGPLLGKWIGFKFVMYNYLHQSGVTAVKLENWIDNDADGKNWQKVYEGADAGKWGRSGTECKVRPDQILSWGGPLATFRWDFAPDVDFKNLSVREISGPNGTTDAINYFTGTSKSSDVPYFGNSDGSTIFNSTTPVQIRNKNMNNNHNITHSGNVNEIYTPYSNNNKNNKTTDPVDFTLPHVGNITNSEVTSGTFDQKTLVVGNKMYVIWVSGDEDDTDVYLKISSDKGLSFDKTIDLSNNPASLSYEPQITTMGENVYVVWEDDEGNSGNTDIFFVRSTDGGKSFSSKINLSNDPSGSGSPQLLVAGQKIYVAWSGTTPDNTDIIFSQSVNNGDYFTEPKNLSQDQEISFDPHLSANGTLLSVAWKGTGGQGDDQQAGTLPINIKNESIQTQGRNELYNASNTAFFDISNFTSIDTPRHSEQSVRSLVASSQNSTSELSNNISDATQAGNQKIAFALQNSSSHSSVIFSKRPVSESVSDDYVSNGRESVNVGTLVNSTKTPDVKNDTSEQKPFTVHQYHEPVAPVVRNENLKTKAEHVRDKILSSRYDNRTSPSFSNPTVEQTPNESNQEQKSNELLITGPFHGKDISTRSSQDRSETKASSTPAKETPDNQQQRQKNPNEEQDIVPSKITKLDTSLGTNSEQSSKTHSQSTTKEKVHVKPIPESKILKQSRQKLDPKIEEDKTKISLKAIHEQKIKDRKRVQHLIDDAKMSLENVKKETKDANTANKKADVAKSILSEAQSGERVAESVQIDSAEVKYLINEANAANEKAREAMEKYEELHQVADNAVKDFNSKYH